MSDANDPQQTSVNEGASSEGLAVNPSEQKIKPKPEAAPKGNVISFNKNILIADSKPMPQFDNGSSHAYSAIDHRDNNKHYVAIIADHGQLPRWQSADMYENLADTSLLRLINHGVVDWPLLGKQQYAFIYDASVGECVVSPEGRSKSSWRQTDFADYVVEPMANVLKILEDRGFCHGSIRPDNIFFSGSDKDQPIVLGDCLSVHPLSSQPSLYMSVERSSAEPFGRGSGSVADDVYAFGVSLATLLMKNDELEGVSDKDILARKIEHGSYAAIIGAERLQTRYVELLRGLLCDDIAQRWKTEELFLWLDGSRMTPPALPRRPKANRPFPFRGKKHLFPDVLVLDLVENVSDAIKVVENGDLSQWIEKAFSSKDISENFTRAMERVGGMVAAKDNVDFTINQLVFAFNPTLPIYYKGRVFAYDGIGGIMARTSYEEGDLSVFTEALLQNILDQAVSLKDISQNEVLALIKSFDVCRTMLRQKKYGNSEEKCIYHLCKTAPCFSPKLKNYFVHNSASCLRGFEDLCAKGGQIALFMDMHGTAFFSVHESRLTERVMYDLSQPEKDSKIAGNLRFLATLQKKAKIKALPGIAKVFLDSLAGVYEVYNNIKLREQVVGSVKKEASRGDLTAMSALIDNKTVRQRDEHAFKLAQRKYKLLQYEYEQYNRSLANKKTYGVVNGQESASLVSWVVAMIITVMSVFAYVSGYKIF